ncbi:MAG: peptidylprolyl isomerase [Chloroflexi bacterium]|nr:peptidylprolyl isomerase [Chloroflexota bacterium]
MKRTLIISSFIVTSIFLLSACASQKETPPIATPFIATPLIVDTPTPVYGCSSISAEPTPVLGVGSLFPPVSAADFSIGPADAPVTLIEYCDFQSGGCRSMATVITELMKNHDDLRFVFRPLPLIGVLDKSDKAILAALAADEQGQFWAMYDLLFAKYDQWVNLDAGKFDAWAVKEAPSLGMDVDQFTAAMNAPETLTRLMSMVDAAKQLNVAAVPLILMNSEQFYLLDYRNMSDTIGLIALGKKQFTQCPPFNIDASKQYIATIQTEKGDIVLELYPDKAPWAVNSFVFLAREGWFDGVTFHRVIPGFAAQAGDPSGTGRGGPGYFFNNEISPLFFDRPGMVGMANSGPDTNGSQFFITFAPAPHLDGSYTIFGFVLSGLDVAENLTLRDPAQSALPPPGDKIIRVTIEEK